MDTNNECDECAKARERIARLEEKVKQLQRLMKSCLVFQRRGATFIDQYKANEQAKKQLDARRAKFHYALLATLTAVIVADKNSAIVELIHWIIKQIIN